MEQNREPQRYSQLIFDKGNMMGQYYLFNKRCWNNWTTNTKKNLKKRFFTKLNSECIIDLM